MKFICALAPDDSEYLINGVNYIVGSSFQSARVETSSSIADRFKRIITSDFTPLTLDSIQSKMTADDMCSAAGKEE